jgi:hypothetical protein
MGRYELEANHGPFIYAFKGTNRNAAFGVTGFDLMCQVACY